MADRLDEIRARADAATPGPWGVWTSMDNTRDILSEAEHPAVPLAGLYGRDGSEHPTAGEDADAEFIAAARSDIPYLLDRLAASEQEAARLRAERDAANARYAEQVQRLQAAIEQAKEYPCPACGHRLMVACGHDALGATTATEAERAGPDGGNGE
jgi:hypothetical protein